MYIQSIGCIYKRIGVYSSFHKAFLLCMWYGIYMGYMDIRDDCFWEYPKVDLLTNSLFQCLFPHIF